MNAADVVERFFSEVWNRRDFSVLDEKELAPQIVSSAINRAIGIINSGQDDA
jgi:hypothetical protein